MSEGTQHTAILLFSLSAEKEKQRKQMGRNGVRVFRKMIQQTRRLAEASGMPVILHTGRKQCGGCFGERLSDGIERVFARGFQSVIAIGNDTPSLSLSDLQQARTALEDGRNILGPSTDGGVYLLGIHRTNWNRASFLKLSWQTSRLFSELMQAAAEDILCLGTKQDLDSIRDVRRLLQDHALSHPLRYLLKDLLLGENDYSHIEPMRYVAAVFEVPKPLRGPPSDPFLSFSVGI